MRTTIVSAGRVIVIAAFLLLSGCAFSERKEAKQLDLTSQIIVQSKDLLGADAELKQFPISVDGFHGQMVVTGHVANTSQKLRAERLIWSVKGVRSVENRINASLVKQP